MTITSLSAVHKHSDSGAVLHEQAGLAAHAEGPSVQAGEVGARGVEGLASFGRVMRASLCGCSARGGLFGSVIRASLCGGVWQGEVCLAG